RAHRLLQPGTDGRVDHRTLHSGRYGIGLWRQVRLGDVGRDPAGEDQPLQQRVRGEPVRAVYAGAGDLTTGVQARDRGPAAQVGTHATRRVVRRRRDGDQVDRRVDAGGRATGDDCREALVQEPAAEVPRVQPHV